MTEHNSAPWAFDAESNYITLHEAPIFRVFRADDFPCIEDEERAAADIEYQAHAQVAVMLLNTIATTDALTVGDAIRALASPTTPEGEER